MRSYFAIGTIVGVGAMLLGACGSDSNGNAPGKDSGAGGGIIGGAGGVGGITGGTGGTGAGGTGATGGGSPGSCAGMCATAVYPDPVPGSDPACYCDPGCVDGNDCCADQATECPSTAGGVCQKFCCSATDCASGQTCTAFDAAEGTLGVCKAGTPTDSGTGGSAGAAADSAAGGSAGAATDGGPATDAGSDAATTDGGVGLPPGCFNLTAECNPLTNQGCDSSAGETCDTVNTGGLVCFPAPNDVPPGGACDNSAGPFCVPLYHCSPP